MKTGNILSILALSVIVLSCSNQNKSGTIKGKLENFNGTYIYLEKITENGDEVIDSVKVNTKGEFKLSNPAKEIDYFILKADSTNSLFLVLNVGENIDLTGDAQSLENSYTVKGSKDSELLKKLRSYDRLLGDSLNTVYASVRNSDRMVADSIGMELQGYYTRTMEEFSKNLIKNNLTSIVSLSATKFLNQQAELGLMQELEKKLSELLPKNRYVQDFKSLVAGLSKLPNGSLAPEISLNTPEGTTIKLSSLKGKVVLIDFWASWCAPCRRENPTIVEAYNQLKGKDFEIYGVSLDNNIEAWKNAIKQDKISWIQVSDLKRWDSEVAKAYQIEAIPTNVLIDREGRILEKGIRGEDLISKISEAIKQN